MKIKISFLLLLCVGISFAQTKTFNSEDLSITPLVDGTLIVPPSFEKIPLAIIIGGSGPTDRNGNQQMLKNNSLRFLAEGLYEEDIASFRYDKRIVKMMKKAQIDEGKIKFDDFIEDAIAVTNYFKKDPRFSKIYIVGHSQGSLVGMVAAQGLADGFISIAGAGQSIDKVIVDQLAKQAPGLKDNARNAFDEMLENGSTTNYSPGLSSIFRTSLQPFLINWIKYDPQVEIKKLEVPVLIINGTKDIQVQISEAEALKSAKPDAQFEIVPKMNHILKEIDGSDIENSKSYNEYNRPVMPEVLDIISSFIKK